LVQSDQLPEIYQARQYHHACQKVPEQIHGRFMQSGKQTNQKCRANCAARVLKGGIPRMGLKCSKNVKRDLHFGGCASD
jgi:hypothetical protein